MEVQAITKNIGMSAQKMREVVRQVQGLPAGQAVAVLAVVPRKGARVLEKTLKSAIANAEDLKANNSRYSSLRTDQLIVREAVAQTAGLRRGYIPKARGSAGPLIMRRCHVRVVLTDQQ